MGKNVILIGMPGTGKSTVGRVLAQRLGYAFIDADDLIRQKAGQGLADILRTRGTEALLAVEETVGKTLCVRDTVIATGGSMVLSEAAMRHLREDGVVVWLETPLSQLEQRLPEHLEDRGIAAPPGSTVEELYRSREPLYARYADLIIPSRPGGDTTADQVEEVMRSIGAL